MGRSGGSSGNTRARPPCARSSGGSRAGSAGPPSRGRWGGIAIATALASLLCRRPARHDVAMTGELTLRGRILPIGGLKEKLTAAARAGVKTVLVPARNRSDIVDVPDEVKQLLDIKPVETIDEVLELALLEPHPLRPLAVRTQTSGQTEARP